MKFLLLFTLKSVKQKLLDDNQDVIKDAIVKKALQDSKSIGVLLLCLNILLSLLFITLITVIILSLYPVSIPVYFYGSSVVICLLSALLIYLVVRKLKNKFMLYEKMSKITIDSPKDYILKPLFDQLHRERLEYSRNRF